MKTFITCENERMGYCQPVICLFTSRQISKPFMCNYNALMCPFGIFIIVILFTLYWTQKAHAISSFHFPGQIKCKTVILAFRKREKKIVGQNERKATKRAGKQNKIGHFNSLHRSSYLLSIIIIIMQANAMTA